MPARPAVLLTRPRRESRDAARLLAAHGCDGIRMPLQSTRIAPPSARLAADLAWAAGAASQVFVSRAAVRAAARLLPQASGATRVAVGAATARALQELGLDCVQAPEGAEDSEGVLALPLLQQVRGLRIAVCAAPGGRTRLVDELRARGADARAVMVYGRLPQRPRPPALAALRAVADRAWLTASSGLLLAALDRVLIGQRLESLRARPLVVASARIADQARALGYRDVRTAHGASARALLDALGATGVQRG